MSNVKHGCTKYEHLIADIYFEPEHVACAFCPMLETYSRNQCRLTGEYIIDTRFVTGNYCPLHIKEETNGADT